MAQRDEFFVAPPNQLREGPVGEGAPSAVLLPGWATDSRILGDLFPGVAAVRVSGALRVDGFADRLATFLDDVAADPVTLFGWSLGGFLAAEFAVKYPSRVRRLVLAGVRRRYPALDVESVRSAFLRDRRACLSGFYAQCFFPSRMKEHRRFREELQEEYIREMDADALLSGLDYLGRTAFPADPIFSIPVKIIHGEKDAVAPVAEAKELACSIGDATFCMVARAPHAVFLDDGFYELASEGGKADD